ncbi:KpsF/GutQ family sugar-phosphate isomerase [Desulfoprunum benzoelyticum]|uniref:Arabinose-5-phosphate isomerase n=1 Tax=Desulfoprunum benzoelyticum TaxID=1506996 RepID=A0A840V125_9BACT|nr:KpsF/GutQ family sugar-phosphate isomerase [Desulfoprunum benzoelyticum]MBB5346901.1 arabinose-5-phosphate isomerase [Desulfoprunum benzoelyticum]MBM9529437.1 KpsF/GutQ family sugar-phosphate isomerase [Desulfoprunum benzoelyticum]
MSIEEAKKVFTIEIQGLTSVRDKINQEFLRAVDLIMECPTRLVITGIGKSGIIGQKIAATLNSTGSPSFFLHPVEAMHGDLGMVTATDVILAISYSGETIELNALLSSMKKRGNTIIAMTGGKNSLLAQAADVVLDIAVPKEACPLGLAPTASTTATLAMGDALSVVLLNRKKFQAEDFRFNHPGGSLGERLKVRVSQVMLTGQDIPVITQEFSAAEAVRVLNEKNLGAVLVVDLADHVVGIVTDGDVRRYVLGDAGLAEVGVSGLMTVNPICIEPGMQAADALSIMQRHEITVLPIIDSEQKLVGILHLHNLLGKGEFRFLV